MGILTGQIDVTKIQEVINTELLPKIGSGLSMTKDYVMELGSRYIEYNIFMYKFGVGLSVLGLLIGIFLVVIGYVKENRGCNHGYCSGGDYLGYYVFGITLTIFGLGAGIACIFGLYGRYMIPEVKIFQAIMGH